jgi:hypothetical protein|tara:strand:- start:113 stop:343 length:231 start_codon:yes stop_codon:yes gene_type:complete
MMKLTFKSALKPNSSCCHENYISLKQKESSLVNLKFYQKLFIVFVSLAIILILPESPRELENICEDYNSIKICSVW